MEDVNILQVVGFKNSGKTTLLEHWIKMLRNNGHEVASIKHHGHAKGLGLPDQQLDSMKFFSAGAISSLTTDGNVLQLHQRKKDWKLQDLITLAKWSQPSVILIEGFKHAPHPKVVIIRSIEDWDSLQTLENIVCVLTHNDVKNIHTHTIQLQHQKQIDNWFFQWLGGKNNEII